MNGRRLVPLGLGVTSLLVLAGIASHGRPLQGGSGRGPTTTFFDYLATTLLIGAVAVAVAAVYLVVTHRWSHGGQPRRGHLHLISALLMLAGAALIALLIARPGFQQRLKQLEQTIGANQQPRGAPAPLRPAPKDQRSARLRWDEIAIVVALLGGAAIVVLAGRNAKKTPRAWLLGRREALSLSLALDESLDDLRNDPDLRRAIVAAYARMEGALARAGLPRHPAEAPFEYLERALHALDTSAESVRRLTALYEWAKFSHHEPEPAMRDEAVDALATVRDELRAPAEEPVLA